MDEQEKKIMGLEINIIELSGDIKHIKGRLDNGISQTLIKVYDKLNELCPQIKENSGFRKMLIKGLIYLSCVSVLGGIIAMAFYLIKNLSIEGG